MLRRIMCSLVPLSTRLNSISGSHKSFEKVRKNVQSRLLASPVLTMSYTISPDQTINHEDLMKLLGANEAILIDVREPCELEEHGKIPNSVNIPLNDLKTALKMSAAEFKEKYNIPLPSENSPLIFSCRSGNRSTKALLAALELGFKNSKHYGGGYLDWQKHHST